MGMKILEKIKAFFKVERHIGAYAALMQFLRQPEVSSDELQMMITVIEKDRTLPLRTQLYLKTWALNKYIRDGYKAKHIVN